VRVENYWTEFWQGKNWLLIFAALIEVNLSLIFLFVLFDYISLEALLSFDVEVEDTWRKMLKQLLSKF